MGNFKHNVEKIKLNLQHDLVAEKISQHPPAKVALPQPRTADSCR